MIITRFAPSPTGHLHIGGLRTALYNYLYAKANNGRFLLRIEDTDVQRNDSEALEGILEVFKWANLEYDTPMLLQSQRIEIYKEYVHKLLESKQAYYCYLSKEQLQSAREANNGVTPINFTRKYRDYQGEIPKNIQPSVRIKAPLEGKISFYDGIKGEISFNASDIDDFVILRSDGVPTYNFVVAIDDALSNITDLIRGDDHLSNTPKQIIIYNALHFTIPRFYHIPMICNAQGKKLSKRDGALSALEYREAGVLPQALLNFLFRLGYSYGDKEIFSLKEMMECFNPTKINSAASACNFSKLYWLNGEYIKALKNSEFMNILELDELKNIEEAKVNLLLEELKVRVNNLNDLKKEILFILNPPALIENKNAVSISYDIKTYNKIFTKDKASIILESLKNFKEYIYNLDIVSIEIAKKVIHDYAHKVGFKPALFMQSLRLSWLGRQGGIDLGAAFYILGGAESQRRINNFLNFANDHRDT